MALILLWSLYGALALGLAIVAGWLGRPWGGGPGAAGARRLPPLPPLLVVLFLTLLPLCFTVRGFLPGTTLSPTPMLQGVPPWAEPVRVEAMAAEAPPNPLLLDPLSQFIPWREAARRDLLFNPAQGAGAALLGNGQSAVLYPTEVLARLLTPFRATTFSQAARLLVAGWGMFLLALVLLAPRRRREAPDGGAMRPVACLGGTPAAFLAALASAVVWVGSGFLQVWRLHPHTLVAATVPWILFFLVRLARQPGPRSAVGLAVTGAVAVAAGHPETLLHALLFGLLLTGLVLWSDRSARPGAWASGSGPRGVRGVGRTVAWGAAAALLAALLAAPLLLPFVENLRVSSEWVLRRDSGTVVERPLQESIQRLRPTFALYALGDPRVEEPPVRGDDAPAAEAGPPATPWPEPWADPWSGPENLAELAGGWVGAVALLLAVLALGHPSPRRRRLAVGLLVVGVVGLLVSVHLVWFSRPFAEVPLLRESLLKRLSIWWALAMAILAGLGLGRWLEGEVPFFRPALVASAAAAMAVSLAAGGPFRSVPAVTVYEWVPLLLVAVALCAVPWLGARGGGRRAVERGVVLLVFALLLIPPVALLGGWVPAVSAAGFYADTLATRFVAERLEEAGPVGTRVAGLSAALVPHSASFFGFGDPRAYDPMTFAPYAEFMGHAGGGGEAGWTHLTDPASPPLAFLGVRYVFEHPASGAREGVEIAFHGHGGLVYENPRALPRLYVPAEVEVHPTPQEAVAAAGRVRDFARRVTVSGLEVAPGGGDVRLLPSAPARVEELAVAARRITALVTAQGDALVATSQPAIPGWRVMLDGEEVESLAVNGAFLGLVVPEGPHRVEMVYAPRSWTLGWLLAAGGLLAGGGLLWLGRRREGPVVDVEAKGET